MIILSPDKCIRKYINDKIISEYFINLNNKILNEYKT